MTDIFKSKDPTADGLQSSSAERIEERAPQLQPSAEPEKIKTNTPTMPAQSTVISTGAKPVKMTEKLWLHAEMFRAALFILRTAGLLKLTKVFEKDPTDPTGERERLKEYRVSLSPALWNERLDLIDQGVVKSVVNDFTTPEGVK